MSNELGLMLITNEPGIAKEAENAGVNRIFVDLETIGKTERQGHLDTHITTHNINDIKVIKKVLKRSELLVRINPIHSQSKLEIEQAISLGADILMLPMFTTQEEVGSFVSFVNCRARTSLLLETTQALARIDDIIVVPGIDEIHIGLNDLHLGMKLDFMFELLSGGIIDYLSKKIRAKGISFGFGGVGRIGEGLIPAEAILKEHERLGSTLVILSRSFHQRATTQEELKLIDIKLEVTKIKKVYNEARNRNEAERERDRLQVKRLVHNIVHNKQ